MQSTFLYNHELVKQRVAFLDEQGFDIKQIVDASGTCRVSVERACDGRMSTLPKLRKVCDAVNLQWDLLFRENLSESQLRRAVRGTVR